MYEEGVWICMVYYFFVDVLVGECLFVCFVFGFEVYVCLYVGCYEIGVFVCFVWIVEYFVEWCVVG